MHNTYKLGAYWLNIPNNEDRQTCQLCGETESMDHILTKCVNRESTTIWNLARNTWPHTGYPWPEIDLGTILGTGCLKVIRAVNEQHPNSQTIDKGATRLLHILISESAHLIWVLRCERVIRGTPHNEPEIRSRWLKLINTRLTEDRIVATKIKRDKGFSNLVINTWDKVIKKENDAPKDWLIHSEVLVGSSTRVFRRGNHVP
jgi:hypothetical protein